MGVDRPSDGVANAAAVPAAFTLLPPTTIITATVADAGA